MRTIKFRLRSADNKILGYEKWYIGELKDGLYKSNPCWLYSKNGKYWNPTPISHRFKDTFTGLLDKNGKEIYEGDILRKRLPNYLRSKNGNQYKMVGWTFAKSYNGFNVADAHSWEVIGYIYENPELLST